MKIAAILTAYLYTMALSIICLYTYPIVQDAYNISSRHGLVQGWTTVYVVVGIE